MDLTVYSRSRMKDTARFWNVSDNYYDPMFNYLVWGFSPGSFFTSVLANDFQGAVQRSHPNNTIQALQNLVGWIHDRFPAESFGSYATVAAWCEISSQDRRAILESTQRLIYTEQEEIMLALRGAKTTESVVY